MRGYARSQKMLAWQIEAMSRTETLPDPSEIIGLKRKGGAVASSASGAQVVDAKTMRAMMMAGSKFEPKEADTHE